LSIFRAIQTIIYHITAIFTETSPIITADFRVSFCGTITTSQIDSFIKIIIVKTLSAIRIISIANVTIRQRHGTIITESCAIATAVMEQSIICAIRTKSIQLPEKSPFAKLTMMRVPITFITILDQLIAPFRNTC